MNKYIWRNFGNAKHKTKLILHVSRKSHSIRRTLVIRQCNTYTAQYMWTQLNITLCSKSSWDVVPRNVNIVRPSQWQQQNKTPRLNWAEHSGEVLCSQKQPQHHQTVHHRITPGVTPLHCTALLLFHCPSITHSLSHPDKTSDSCCHAVEARRRPSGRITLQSDRAWPRMRHAVQLN